MTHRADARARSLDPIKSRAVAYSAQPVRPVPRGPARPSTACPPAGAQAASLHARKGLVGFWPSQSALISLSLKKHRSVPRLWRRTWTLWECPVRALVSKPFSHPLWSVYPKSGGERVKLALGPRGTPRLQPGFPFGPSGGLSFSSATTDRAVPSSTFPRVGEVRPRRPPEPRLQSGSGRGRGRSSPVPRG